MGESSARSLWLSVVLTLLMGLVGTVLAQTLLLPGLVAAQDTRLRAEELTVVETTAWIASACVRDPAFEQRSRSWLPTASPGG